MRCPSAPRRVTPGAGLTSCWISHSPRPAATTVAAEACVCAAPSTASAASVEAAQRASRVTVAAAVTATATPASPMPKPAGQEPSKKMICQAGSSSAEAAASVVAAQRVAAAAGASGVSPLRRSRNPAPIQTSAAAEPAAATASETAMNRLITSTVSHARPVTLKAISPA